MGLLLKMSAIFALIMNSRVLMLGCKKCIWIDDDDMGLAVFLELADSKHRDYSLLWPLFV